MSAFMHALSPTRAECMASGYVHLAHESHLPRNAHEARAGPPPFCGRAQAPEPSFRARFRSACTGENTGHACAGLASCQAHASGAGQMGRARVLERAHDPRWHGGWQHVEYHGRPEVSAAVCWPDVCRPHRCRGTGHLGAVVGPGWHVGSRPGREQWADEESYSPGRTPKGLRYSKDQLKPLMEGLLDEISLFYFLREFSSFRTRFYLSDTGKQSQEWLLTQLQEASSPTSQAPRVRPLLMDGFLTDDCIQPEDNRDG
jgi:hypothetical protein